MLIEAWCGLCLNLSDCSVMEFGIPIEKLIKNTQNRKREKDWMYEGNTKLE